jgi:hypothetical protein
MKSWTGFSYSMEPVSPIANVSNASNSLQAERAYCIALSFRREQGHLCPWNNASSDRALAPGLPASAKEIPAPKGKYLWRSFMGHKCPYSLRKNEQMF